MNGVMVVAKDLADVDAMLAAAQPKIIRKWQMLDFHDLQSVAQQLPRTAAHGGHAGVRESPLSSVPRRCRP